MLRVARLALAATLVVLVACSAPANAPSPASGSASVPSPSSPKPSLQPVDQWTPEAGPFAEPEQIYSQGGHLVVTLTAKQQLVEVAGSPIVGTVYNGTFIGPTLHVHPGDTIELTLVNQLNQMTNFHFHGFHVSPSGESDNVLRTVEPGATAQYHVDIPTDHEPGLFWYHSHMHGVSSGQVYGGLSGLIVMEGLEDLLPPDLQDVTQRQIALRDLYTLPAAPDAIPLGHGAGTTSQAPATVPNKNSVADPAAAPVRLINGVLLPTIDIAPGETQLWRLANIGANTYYDIQADGITFHVIAEDANPVWEVWDADHLVMPPGKRFEVLVQGPPEGDYALRELDFKQGVTPANALEVFPVRLGTVTSSGAARTPIPLPVSLRPKESLDDAQIAARRKFVFAIDFAPGHACTHAKGCGKDAVVLYTINHEVFDPKVVNVTAKLGTVEEWVLTNDSTELHPFHIHVNDFQVMSINGEPYDAHGLQDIVSIPVGGEVVIRNPFDDFTGKFVFHCHILNHEDGGMMQIIQVVK